MSEPKPEPDDEQMQVGDRLKEIEQDTAELNGKPPRNQCAVLALRRALQGIHNFRSSDDSPLTDQETKNTILAGLMQVDETLPDGDRAMQAGFTDAAITEREKRDRCVMWRNSQSARIEMDSIHSFLEAFHPHSHAPYPRAGSSSATQKPRPFAV